MPVLVGMSKKKEKEMYYDNGAGKEISTRHGYGCQVAREQGRVDATVADIACL